MRIELSTTTGEHWKNTMRPMWRVNGKEKKRERLEQKL